MRRAAVIVVAAIALVAAGCGGGGGKQSATPLELVSQAVSKTSTDNSAKFHMELTEKAGGVGPFTFTADGASSSAGSAKMSLDMSSIAQLLSGAQANGDDWKADVILDATNPKAVVEYMRLPALAKQIPGGKPWVKIDLNELGKLGNVNLTTLLQSAGQQDPTQALQMLRAVGDVKEVGSEQVDGVDTTHYTGTIDPQKVADKFGATGLAPVLAASGAQSIPIEVWVDGDGYVRKFQESVKGTNATLNVATTMSDFGTKVDVTPPPAGQTTDLTALLKKK